MVTIEIPVKSYVKSYLETQFKAKEIPLTMHTVIGKYFYALIKNGNSIRCRKEKYENSCVFVLSEDIFIRKGFIIDDNGVIQFNSFMEDLIKREVFGRIDLLRELKSMGFREAIQKACEQMKFDESVMPYETIKKAYYRHRNYVGNVNS